MRLVSTVTDENGEEFEIADKYARENMQEKVNMPTNLSEFRNDMGFIDRTVDDLENYYLKEDTYSRTEISELLTKKMAFVIVDALPSIPAQDELQCVFLVRRADKGNSKNSDVYDEYIWAGDGWELIGDTSMDLSDYYTKKETDDANKAQDAALAAARKELGDEDAAIRKEISDLSDKTDGALSDIDAAYKQADKDLEHSLSLSIGDASNVAFSAMEAAQSANNAAQSANNVAEQAMAGMSSIRDRINELDEKGYYEDEVDEDGNPTGEQIWIPASDNSLEFIYNSAIKVANIYTDEVAERVADVESKIPDTASADNKLIDAKTAQTLIGTSSGTFIGTFESIDDLRAYDGKVHNNDYAFVYGAVPEHGGEVDEYFPDGLETADAPERYVLAYRHDAGFEVGEGHTFTVPLGNVTALLRDCTDWYVDINAASDAADAADAALEIRAYYGTTGNEMDAVVGQAALGSDERQFHLHWSPDVGADGNYGLSRDYMRIEISSTAGASVNHLRLYAKRERYTYTDGMEEADGSTPDGYLLSCKYVPYRNAGEWSFPLYPVAPGAIVRARFGGLDGDISVDFGATGGEWVAPAAQDMNADSPYAVFAVPFAAETYAKRFAFSSAAESLVVEEVKVYLPKTIDYGADGIALIGEAEYFDATPNGYDTTFSTYQMVLGFEEYAFDVAEEIAVAMRDRLLIVEASFEDDDNAATVRIELLGADGASVGGGSFQSRSVGAARMYVRYTGESISGIRVSADGTATLDTLRFYSPGQNAGEEPGAGGVFSLRRAAAGARAEVALSEAVIYSRYKYSDGHWLFEYTLNNSGFTQHQYEAIESGITAEKVAKIAELEAENAALKKRVADLEARPTVDTTLTARVTALEAQLGGITFSIV